MRYLPLTDTDRRDMLEVIGVKAADDLFSDIPGDLRLRAPLDLPPHMGEIGVERAMSAFADRNTPAGSVPFFIGGGAYRHHVPASVDHLIQRSEFLTAYTPYQPEIAQGTLQMLFEFQTQVAMMTAMDAANASMYDGSTACAEAILMARRVTRRDGIILADTLHPHYADVARTLSTGGGGVITDCPVGDVAARIDKKTACVVVQTPDVFGALHDLAPVARAAHDAGALLVAVVTEVVSLGAVTPPGDMGADIVVCEGQSIGNALSFGGPYLGLFATRKKYIRQMPGRLCGRTSDENGRRGFVLTLATREQHIRREKATSNICTNSGLCCLAFAIHMSLLGRHGFPRLAQVNHANAVALAEKLEAIPGVEITTPAFFNEFTLRTPRSGTELVDALAEKNILGGIPARRLMPDNPEAENLVIVAATETNTGEDMDAFAAALAGCLS